MQNPLQTEETPELSATPPCLYDTAQARLRLFPNAQQQVDERLAGVEGTG